MEVKYAKAIKAGITGGIVIFSVVVLLTVSSMLCVTVFGWIAIVFLLRCVGALSVRETLAATLNDALVVSAVAGTTAAVINAIGLIALNIIISIINLSVAGLVTSIICYTPLALLLGIIFPVIGGGLWHFARMRGLVK